MAVLYLYVFMYIYIYTHIPDICIYIYIYAHINASFPLSLFLVVSATFLLKPVFLLHEILNLFSCAPRDCKPYKGPVVHLRFVLHIFQEIYPKGLKEIWHFESAILLKSLLENKVCPLGVILPQDGTRRFHWLQCFGSFKATKVCCGERLPRRYLHFQRKGFQCSFQIWCQIRLNSCHPWKPNVGSQVSETC